MNANGSRELKDVLRKEILAARARLSKEERDEKDRILCAKLFELPEFNRAGLVMAYMDFRGEPGTKEILEECFKREKRVALPVVAGTEGTARGLQAFEPGPGGGLLKNRYGISEPDPGRANRADEADIDLVIVPGVAFDLMKYRIGYGAGYYDRFLTGLRPDCVTVGLAYELQIVDRIPAEKHDIPLSMVLTEHRTII
jgi:5-formyltetrahydrofolate cyclo-ligase